MLSRSIGGRFVLRKSTLIWIVAFICITGIESYNIMAGEARDGQSDVCARMIKYLRQQNPPELRAVEVWNNEFGPGLKLTTAHYEIFTTLLRPLMLRHIAEIIESAYKAYSNQLP